MVFRTLTVAACRISRPGFRYVVRDQLGRFIGDAMTLWGAKRLAWRHDYGERLMWWERAFKAREN